MSLSRARVLSLVCLLVVTAACGSASPTAPTAIPALVTSDLAYDINVPDRLRAAALIGEYPHGVRIAPITAQLTWDFSPEYGGSANAYYGPLPGAATQYQLAGILIAPTAVARLNQFLGALWSGIGLVPTTTYVWVGRFVFTPYNPDVNALPPQSPIAMPPVYIPRAVR